MRCRRVAQNQCGCRCCTLCKLLMLPHAVFMVLLAGSMPCAYTAICAPSPASGPLCLLDRVPEEERAAGTLMPPVAALREVSGEGQTTRALWWKGG